MCAPLSQTSKGRSLTSSNTKDLSKDNLSDEQSVSEDEQIEEETGDLENITGDEITTNTCIKQEHEQEPLSCYCSASHTDNFSTDEHDSLRDNQELLVVKSLQQSDSGADLTEQLACDFESEWNKYWAQNGEKLIWESWIRKYSAYINPDYLQNAQEGATVEENNLVAEEPFSQQKLSKFSFDSKELQNFTTNQKESDKPECSNKNRLLIRNLSGSDEKLFTEVSEGWNPLSPLSIEGETEAERLLSSRCGSHASSSVRTVDSMTNVTRMTISSLELSNSTSSSSSSDSFSSVSSVNSSLSTEESEGDYQHQWDALWKKHYEEEYLEQYNKFIKTTFHLDFKEEIDSHSPHTSLRSHSAKSPLLRKNVHKVFQGKVSSDISNQTSKVDLLMIDSLGHLLSKMDVNDIENESENIDIADSEEDTAQNEAELMTTLGLPTRFGKKSDDSSLSKTIVYSDDFLSGRNKVIAAYKLVGIEFRDKQEAPMTGYVDYKMKHIRQQNRNLKFKKDQKVPIHVRFDDDGNAIIPRNDNDNEEDVPFTVSDSSKLSSVDEEEMEAKLVKADDKTPEIIPKRKKRKKKLFLPQEIKDNTRLRKYWYRRFSLFSKFNQGIKLDEESWYSVTPELVAKHDAERCKCNVIVDAFCGVGGNTIQFALTCNRVIAIDIDAKKVEMARSNAQVYGVADKIDFIVGDFFQLAESLKADIVFLSPPWGGASYLLEPIYDLNTNLKPVPISELLSAARKISGNIAIYLPKNSNTHPLVMEAGPGGKVEIQQNFVNKKLIAITAYYGELIKEK